MPGAKVGVCVGGGGERERERERESERESARDGPGAEDGSKMVAQ